MCDSRRQGARVWALGTLLTLTLPLLAANLPVEQGADAQQPAATEPAAPVAVTPPVIQAVRKFDEFEFVYQSFSTFYSCSSLETKLKRILVALGADSATRVRVSGCEFGSQIARLPVARIRTTIPVEATPAALAELEKTRPQRELAARLRKDRSAADIDAQFPAQWKRVSLSRGSLGIESGDCELIEQLSRRVLPRLAVRVVDSKFGCAPGRQSSTQPKLEVEALVGVTTDTDATGKPADSPTKANEQAAQKLDVGGPEAT